MQTDLYVISDLHLGGAPAGDGGRGFQICPPATQAMLAAFIDGLSGRRIGRECRLVIAGDIVDFLAEEPFQAFTVDPLEAQRKFQSILNNTKEVWDALSRFVVEREGALTLMLGNHDIELSLPGVRQMLLERLGPGRVDFTYDNEALTIGPVLIEHGNRFDAWNAVPHGALRRLRSQLSRRLPTAPDFPALPGSRLVVDVMNPLKKQYPFIDLLKPEGAGALPIAAALGAPGWRDVWRFFGNFRRQWAVDYEESGEPSDETYIAAAADDDDQQAFDLAEKIAAGGDAQQVSAIGDLLGAAKDEVDQRVRAARRAALFKAFRGQLDAHRNTFAVDREIDTYLKPARTAAEAGFAVVVYGHTHLAKSVPLGEPGAKLPVYLNSGTWADLMRVPDPVWTDDAEAGRKALEEFVDDLERSALARWRRPVPTYAHVVLDGGSVQSAEVRFADGGQVVDTAGLMQRLAAGDA